MSDAEWEIHKVEIERLYIQENKTLRDVIDHMTLTHQFERSKQQYERRLKKWGLKKYQMTQEKWKAVGQLVETRKRKFNKESEVQINGVYYPLDKVRKEISRQGYVSAIEKFSSVSSPTAPDGIVVYTPDVPGTPGGLDMQSTGSTRFPWFTFLDYFGLDNSQENISSLLVTPASNHTLATVHHSAVRGFVGTLSTYMKHSTDDGNTPIRTRITAVLNALMPQENKGQHQKITELLFKPNHSSFESIKIQLFLLSNNFMLSGQIHDTSFQDIEKHDQLILKTLPLLGFNILENFQEVVSSFGPTAGAIAEQLFATAVRLHDLNLMDFMLKAGVNPNMPIQFEWDICTPVEYVAGIEDHNLALEMAKSLLANGADPNRACGDSTAITRAFEDQNNGLTQFLTAHGGLVASHCLRSTIPNDDSITAGLLLNSGADPNWVDKDDNYDEWPILFSAIYKKRFKIAQILLTKGAMVNKTAYYSAVGGHVCPLGLAFAEGDIRIANLLLEHGAEINMELDDLKPQLAAYDVYIPPLACAVKQEHIKVIKLLLAKGAQVNAQSHFNSDDHEITSILGLAAENGNIQITNLLLEHGAKVDMEFDDQALQLLKRDIKYIPPLACAGRRGHIELVQLLLAHGAEVNAYTSTFYESSITPILGLAAQSGNIQITNLLLEHGAKIDMDLDDPDLRQGLIYISPLDLAVKSRKTEVVELLLTKGANLNIIVRFHTHERNNAYTNILGAAAKSWCIPMLKLLLTYDVEVNMNSTTGQGQVGEENGLTYIQPLTLAVESNETAAVEMLLKAGADIDLAGEIKGKRLIEYAATNNNLELCRVLIDNGAKIDRPAQKTQFPSALMIAASKNNIAIVNILLNAGARANDVHDQPPGTAFGIAIEAGNIEIAELIRLSDPNKIKHKIRHIKNRETAMYLEQVGLLGSILAEWGNKILITSIQTRSLDLTEYLLNQNPFYGSNQEGITPLEAAISCGNLNLALFFLNCEVPVTEHDLTAAVWEALHTKSPGALHGLLKRFRGKAATAVSMAIEHGDKDMVKLLLQSGVDPQGEPVSAPYRYEYGYEHHRSKVGWWHKKPSSSSPASVLEQAVQKWMLDIVVDLLKSTNWPSSLTGRALVCSIEYRLDLTEQLLLAGADVNQAIESFEDRRVRSLEAAFDVRNVSLVRRLIKLGADINYLPPGDFRRTPLQQAAELGNMELVTILLEANANPNESISHRGGATALQIAAAKGFLAIVQKLISVGADINAKPAPKAGRTALEGAAEHGRIDMLQFLINSGAAIEGEGDHQYNRAVEFAEENGHYAAARLLKSHKQCLL